MSRLRTARAAIAQRIAASDDSGVSLIFALIFITVVALVIGVVLSYIATAAHGNITERAVAARESAAEGAAQIAINDLRTSSYDGPDACPSLNPPPGFYTANSLSYAATVTCKYDGADSSGGGAGKGGGGPLDAILTLGTSNQEDGLSLQANGNNNTFRVEGGIFSNSNIVANRLSSDSSVIARDDCTGTITANPKRCNYGNTANSAGNDPNYGPPVPDGSTPHPAVPGCVGSGKKNNLVKLSPGIYSSSRALNALNTLTDGKCNDTFWFQPGTYYFSFSGTWTINGGYVVGGTPTPGQVVDGKAPTIPGACQAPYGNDQPQPGVEFVFGGTSQLALSKGSMELCGDPQQDSPPIAIYGLKSAVGQGPNQVPAESGCITRVNNGCSVISSDNSPNSEMYVNGLTYVPKAAIDLNLNNGTRQVFGYSVIARHLAIDATDSADLSDAIISGPPSNGESRVTVVYLQVCVRQTTDPQGTCSASLDAKVGLTDPSGSPVPGKREVTIYSWTPGNS